MFPAPETPPKDFLGTLTVCVNGITVRHHVFSPSVVPAAGCRENSVFRYPKWVA